MQRPLQGVVKTRHWLATFMPFSEEFHVLTLSMSTNLHFSLCVSSGSFAKSCFVSVFYNQLCIHNLAWVLQSKNKYCYWQMIKYTKELVVFTYAPQRCWQRSSASLFRPQDLGEGLKFPRHRACCRRYEQSKQTWSLPSPSLWLAGGTENNRVADWRFQP